MKCKKGCGATFSRATNRRRHEGRKTGCRPAAGEQVVPGEPTVEGEPPDDSDVGEQHTLPAKKFVCSKIWCGKSFASKFSLDRHQPYCRKQVDKNKCFLCKRTFSRTSHLRRHMKSHSDGRRKRLMRCKSCKKGFVRQDLLEKHEKHCNSTTEAPKRTKKNSRQTSVGEREGNTDFLEYISSLLPSLPENSSANMVCDDDSEDDNLNVNDLDQWQPEYDAASTSRRHAKHDDSDNYHNENDDIDWMPENDDASNSSSEHVDFSLKCLANETFTNVVSFEAPTVFVLDNISEHSHYPAVEDATLPVDIEDATLPVDIEDATLPVDIISDNDNNDDVDSAATDSTDEEVGSHWVAEELGHHMTTVEVTMSYLRKEIHLSKRSLKKKIATAKHIKEVFHSKIDDPDFLDYLARNLHFDSVDDLTTFLQFSEKDYSFVTGRRDHKVTLETAQKVVDFWKSNAVISVDRRNNRYLVRKHPKKLHPVLRKVADEEISTVEKNGKFQAHRHIYTKSVRKLHKIFLRDNPLNYVSKGLFHQLKPFYIGKPTQNEMLSCLCITCLNAHGLYEPSKRSLDDLPDSLTEYLTQTIKCEKDENLNFHKLSCIKSECDKKCSLSTSVDRRFEDKGAKKFYVFERIPTYYYNKDGKKVEYLRTTRVDKYATLDVLYETLKSKACDYMRHRHGVVSDQVFWDHLKQSIDQPYLHLDYSQNIALKPKHEAQSAHFSGKEQTLHCTVLAEPDKNVYIYHLSDDTLHDCTMTFHVLESIIREHPNLVENGTLIIKSDNCATQYKSKKTFQEMKNIAQRYNCTIFWFYGEAGHGRGLVDAMSSFGCKKLLKEAIVCEDVWFADASEMVEFLKGEVPPNGNKEYYFVDEKDTAARRRKGRKTLKREGCMKFNLMAVNPEGQWMVRETLDIDDFNLVNLVFDDPKDCYDDNDIEYEEYVDEDEFLLQQEGIPHELVLPVVYDVITPGNFVGLRSDSEAFEEFYIVEVISKHVAKDIVEDAYGHRISKGDPYLCVNYLEKSAKSTVKKIRYNRSKTKEVYINVGEIFATNIEMQDDLTMSPGEYQSLLAELFV